MPYWLLLAAATAGIVCSLCISRRQAEKWERAALRSRETVSVIIPALNEAKALQHTLKWLQQLMPPVHEVIVVDGDSSDSTIATAEAGGARVVRSARGRAIQMNAGAAAASGDLLCFLHADSQPPRSLVHLMRRTLADPMTVLGGFRTLIRGTNEKLLRFMTAHHLVKTYYLVVLARPMMWLRGGICLFGDQTMFCRKADFAAVGGYDESLPIMEDVQLCITMHEAGPAAGQGRAACASNGAKHGGAVASSMAAWRGRRRRRGCIRMIWWPPAQTSGRRLEALGNWQATRIHFTVGLGWYLGISRQQLFKLYNDLYSHSYR